MSIYSINGNFQLQILPLFSFPSHVSLSRSQCNPQFIQVSRISHVPYSPLPLNMPVTNPRSKSHILILKPPDNLTAFVRSPIVQSHILTLKTRDILTASASDFVSSTAPTFSSTSFGWLVTEPVSVACPLPTAAFFDAPVQ